MKLTNTFPVDIKRQELPGEEMYMSGKALFPLSISVAARLAESFDGKLPMSFSGGADQKNIDQIVGCGIWPVTVATVLLKPGGYKWLTRIAEKADTCEIEKDGKVQVEELKKLTDIEFIELDATLVKDDEAFEKEVKRLNKELARVNGMLANPNFVSKAPEKKINEEKEKQAKYQEMMKQVQSQLENLKK